MRDWLKAHWAKILVGFLLIFPIVWSGAWFVIAKRVQDWLVAQRGAAFTFAPNVIEGFPLVWRLRLDSFVLAPPVAGAGRIEASAVDATVVPWRPRTVEFSPASELVWRRPGSQPMRFAVRGGAATADFAFGGRLDGVGVAFEGIDWVAAPGAPVVRAAQFLASAQRVGEGPEIHIVVDLNGVDFGVGRTTAIAARLERAAFSANLRPQPGVPPGPVAALDPRGTLEIDRMVVRWGPLTVDGSARLVHDRGLWAGPFAGRADGLDKIAPPLVREGVVRRHIADAALAIHRGQGSPGRYELTVEDGIAALAGMPVLFVPR